MRRYAVPEHVLFELFDDEAVVVNLVSGQYYSLNAVAVRMWSLLREGMDLDHVAEAVVEEFDSAAPEVASDLRALVGELAALGLLVDAPPKEARR